MRAYSSLFTDEISLDPSSPTPLFRQLYKQIKQAIVNGRLQARTKVPSTRSLATELRVSRNTVQSAFAELIADGYLEGRGGSGTFVAQQVHIIAPTSSRPPHRFPNLSKRGMVISKHIGERLAMPPALPLIAGIPARDAFSGNSWSKLMSHFLKSPGHLPLGHVGSTGYEPLREAIATYVRTTRGIRCCSEQVIVSSSWQQAFSLAAPLLLDPGDLAWMEDPGCPIARRLLVEAGAQVVPMPVDGEGLIPGPLSSELNPRLIYLSPPCQLPLGGVMGQRRRLDLLDIANHKNAWLVEDDSDSIFQYSGYSIPPLYALDNEDRVLYICSLSKILYPFLRLAFVIVPNKYVDMFATARLLSEHSVTIIEQAVLAEFMAEGYLTQHIRHIRALYAERQQLLVDAVREELEGVMDICPAQTGLHLVGYLPHTLNDQLVSRAAASMGVYSGSVSACSVLPTRYNGLQLGYAPYREEEIRGAVHILGAAIDRILRRPRRPAEGGRHHNPAPRKAAAS